MKNCAIILGDHVNAYEIIRELKDFEVEDIILFYLKRTHLSFYSNIPKKKIKLKLSSLLNELQLISEEYNRIILYSTNDLLNDWIDNNSKNIPNNIIIPFNDGDILNYQNKLKVYKICEKIGVPYPKTQKISDITDLESVSYLKFPIIIKPNTREDLQSDVFRNITFINIDDYKAYKGKLISFLNDKIEFMASEFVPGDTYGTIYSYASFSINGEVLKYWCGRKLAQYPNDTGVFSTGTSIEDPTLEHYGKKLIEAMNLSGINQPEFKYDHRDNTFKLMEINFRTMMWHRTGTINNCPLSALQYFYYTDKNKFNDLISLKTKEKFNYSYLPYELINLFTRKNYLKRFRTNLFNRPTKIAIFNKKDLLPFLYDIFIGTFKEVLARILKR